MYIYFEKLNAVITCEEYPQVLSVEEMKKNKMENLCNRWVKTDVNNDGEFLLSYKYFEDGEIMYLQNSGSIDIVCTKPYSRYNEICQVKGHLNVYQWIPKDNKYGQTTAFVLHARYFEEDKNSRYLSDMDMIEELSTNENIDNCHIIFAESI